MWRLWGSGQTSECSDYFFKMQQKLSWFVEKKLMDPKYEKNSCIRHGQKKHCMATEIVFTGNLSLNIISWPPQQQKTKTKRIPPTHISLNGRSLSYYSNVHFRTTHITESAPRPLALSKHIIHIIPIMTYDTDLFNCSKYFDKSTRLLKVLLLKY